MSYNEIKTTYCLHYFKDDYYFDSIAELKYYMIGKDLKPYIAISNITTTLDLIIIEVYPIFI